MSDDIIPYIVIVFHLTWIASTIWHYVTDGRFTRHIVPSIVIGFVITCFLSFITLSGIVFVLAVLQVIR